MTRRCTSFIGNMTSAIYSINKHDEGNAHFVWSLETFLRNKSRYWERVRFWNVPYGGKLSWMLPAFDIVGMQLWTGPKSNDSPIHLGESLLGHSDWRIKDGEYIFPRILVGKERDIGQVGVWILSKPPGAVTLTLGLSGQAVSMQYSSAMEGFMVKFNCLSFENHWKYLSPI